MASHLMHIILEDAGWMRLRVIRTSSNPLLPFWLFVFVSIWRATNCGRECRTVAEYVVPRAEHITQDAQLVPTYTVQRSTLLWQFGVSLHIVTKHKRHHAGVSMPRVVHANDRGVPFWLANRLHVRHFQLVHSLRNAASPRTLALRACKCAEDLTYGFWILESLPRAEPDGLTCRNSPARPARLSTRPRRVRILKMSPTRPFSLVPCTWPSPDEFDSDSDSESCARSSRACVFTSNAIVWQVGQLALSLIVRCATKASLLSLG